MSGKDGNGLTPNGYDGIGGGGGGVGELEIDTTNPSQLSGLSSVSFPTVIKVPNTLNTMSIDMGKLYSQSQTVTVDFSGIDSLGNETLELAQDSSFTQNVKTYSLTGTAESASGNTYYSYTGSESYTFTGVALNTPANLYAKLVDANGSSDVLQSAITLVLDTTPPSVSVTVDAGQQSTTTLPLTLSTTVNDPVAQQGLQMLVSMDGQHWYNVVTSPLAIGTLDDNGNPISSGLVSATANASTTNPVFVQASSVSDVQPYSTLVTGISLGGTPTVVNTSGTAIPLSSQYLWNYDTVSGSSVIKSGMYSVYVLAQDSNKNQGTGSAFIYYQDSADMPQNPTLSTVTTSGSSTTPSSGLISTSSSGLVDLIGDTNISWPLGTPTGPISGNAALVNLNGVPTIVTNSSTVAIKLPVSSSATEYEISTNNGQSASNWQNVSDGTIEAPITLPSGGLQTVSVRVSNGQIASNWMAFPVLVDDELPTMSATAGSAAVPVGSNDTVTISLSGQNAASPLFYQVGGGAWQKLPANHQITVQPTAQGENQIAITVSDLAGNEASANVSVIGL